MLYDYNQQSWLDYLETKEQEAINIVYDNFKAKPLGCIAISQMMFADVNKPMDSFIEEVLHTKFSKLKVLAIEC